MSKAIFNNCAVSAVTVGVLDETDSAKLALYFDSVVKTLKNILGRFTAG